jgi:hypothetical protein
MKMQVHQLWPRKQEIKIIHKRARYIDKLFWLEETSKLAVGQKFKCIHTLWQPELMLGVQIC